MAEQTQTQGDDQAQDDRGRLVLATGTIVKVPAESVSVATEHYDPKAKTTVPVVSSFIVRD